jgi:hypothetical protein
MYFIYLFIVYSEYVASYDMMISEQWIGKYRKLT